MVARKFVFGFVILAFFLVEANAGKSHRRFKQKSDNNDASSGTDIEGQDLSLNSTSHENTQQNDGVMLPVSSSASNATDSVEPASGRNEKKPHRSKHRRQHHKRKHYKRLRKNKRRDEKEADTQDHDLNVAGLTGSENSDISRDSKQLRRRNHPTDLHRKSDKHHQRQQRRLQRRKKLRSHRKSQAEQKDGPSPTDP